ncbi:MAG: DMT family transporter [Cohaesibacteraceae bacterium]
MTKQSSSDRRADLIGSAFMVAAMAGFAVEDVFIKAASQTLPVSQLLVLFGLGGALLFSAIALANRENLLAPDAFSRPMRVRVFFEITGRLFFVLALAFTPLSTTTVILQAAPLVVVAGAALFFGEKVGWRRWLAIALGMVGVIIMVQPGAESFSLLSLLAVIGMLGFAGRDLASRAAPASLSTAVLGAHGFASIMLAGLLYALWERVPFVWPQPQAALFVCGAVLAGLVGYSSLMKAMRTGDVSAVTPFRYTRLLFGIAFGVVLFGEELSLAMLAGCGLIVCSGLFILWRGKKAGT